MSQPQGNSKPVLSKSQKRRKAMAKADARRLKEMSAQASVMLQKYTATLSPEEIILWNKGEHPTQLVLADKMKLKQDLIHGYKPHCSICGDVEELGNVHPWIIPIDDRSTCRDCIRIQKKMYSTEYHWEHLNNKPEYFEFLKWARGLPLGS